MYVTNVMRFTRIPFYPRLFIISRSVVISLRLLPKIFVSFHHQGRGGGGGGVGGGSGGASGGGIAAAAAAAVVGIGGCGSDGTVGMDVNQITLWAFQKHSMMDRFFQNLETYTKKRCGDDFYSHCTHVQVRLAFLSHVFSPSGLPESIRYAAGLYSYQLDYSLIIID